MKTSLKIFMGMICLIIVMIVGFNVKRDSKSSELYNGLPINYTNAIFAFNTSTPEKAIGVSDYVFVAKVNEILRTEYKNPVEIETSLTTKKTIYDPYTVYSISVIKNIKGHIITSKPIELVQFGGISKDGENYTFIENSKYLEIGEYYVLMPGVFKETGEIDIADPNRIVSLGNIEPSESNISYMNIVEKYENSYKNEYIPEDDNGKILFTKELSKYDLLYEK